jgi:hypothetical protein
MAARSSNNILRPPTHLNITAHFAVFDPDYCLFPSREAAFSQFRSLQRGSLPIGTCLLLASFTTEYQCNNRPRDLSEVRWDVI